MKVQYEKRETESVTHTDRYALKLDWLRIQSSLQAEHYLDFDL